MTSISLISELIGESNGRLDAARVSFWEYCKLINPSFYKESRDYLRQLCEALQALVERRIIWTDGGWCIYDKYVKKPDSAKICRKFMLNIPPRHGKSYTLTLLAQWLFGTNADSKIITVSYNETLASRFSGNVRDGIDATKIDSNVTVFNDVFPKVHIKQGDSARQLWSLEGKYFSYLGTGFGGTITGIGCNVGIIDDPIKNAEEANNELVLDKQWSWYTDTFLSRIEEGGIQIVNMTRWSTKDICGRLLDAEDAADWYVMQMPACIDEQNGIMLCDELLSFESWLDKKSKTSREIFLANYMQQPVDVEGRLYESFKTYSELPSHFTEICAYCDTADTGSDYLCMIAFGIYDKEAYVLDVLYTQQSMEYTEKAAAELLERNLVNMARIEANSGGRGFARNVRSLLKTNRCNVTAFTNHKNKQSRILTQSSWVCNHIYYPENWKDRFPDYWKAMVTYQRQGKNKHDDAADATTGVAETVQLIWRL